jgi:hypothetical protein
MAARKPAPQKPAAPPPPPPVSAMHRAVHDKIQAANELRRQEDEAAILAAERDRERGPQ